MDDLADRAARVASRHPSAVLPFQELLRLVRGSGVSVSDGVLLHSLTTQPGRFRLIDPWRGPWRGLVPKRRRSAGDAASEALGGGSDLPPGPWVVAERRPEPWSPRSDGFALRRLRETLVHLGWTLDARSGRDVARWCAMVGEGGRVRRELTRGSRGRGGRPAAG